MAKISTVDYEELPSKATAMEEEAVKLNEEISSAYESIDNMRSSWYGTRYNSLVTSFNEIISTVNEMLQLVVYEIPYALRTVAYNYSVADENAIASPEGTEPNKITEIAESTEVGLRFITSDVENIHTNVVSNFDAAIDEMNSIKSTFDTVTWESEAADAFRDKLSTLKESIESSFSDIKSQFESLMSAAEEEIEEAESSNTVS